MLEIDRINTYYNQEVHVLKDISINVGDGEFVALFGPNGHGKSTLLKTLCGLLRPASGSIKFNGVEIAGLQSEKIVEMGIVYIAEERHLFPHMTVLENLKLGAYPRHARRQEKENLEYVFHLFPKLKEFVKRLALTLSGGEARMVAIGRGLMSSAKFLAIDEPSFGLAPIVRHDVFQRISEISKDKGIGILLVEQNVVEASPLAERIYVMEDGRISLEASRDEVLNNEQIKNTFMGL
jgi:branched-chain amino acid transport system ATP-binding protein